MHYSIFGNRRNVVETFHTYIIKVRYPKGRNRDFTADLIQVRDIITKHGLPGHDMLKFDESGSKIGSIPASELIATILGKEGSRTR